MNQFLMDNDLLFEYLLGTAIGTVISLVTSGLIADNPNLGWEWIFYIHGGLPLIWCILWVGLVNDSPEVHPFISETECKYIRDNQSSRKTATEDVT